MAYVFESVEVVEVVRAFAWIVCMGGVAGLAALWRHETRRADAWERTARHTARMMNQRRDNRTRVAPEYHSPRSDGGGSGSGSPWGG